MSTDIKTQQLIINKLSKAQYEALTDPSDTELYLTPDTTEQDIEDAVSTHNSSNSAHSTLFNNKQNTLTEGAGIDITNDTISITQATSTLGGIVADARSASTETQEVKIDTATGKLYVAPSTNLTADEQTIHNDNDTISTIGVKAKDTNGTILYDWIGTKAEWEAGRADSSIPDTWLCWITDEVSTSIIGKGVPAGGTVGQALVKKTATDYDTEWKTLKVSDLTDDTATNPIDKADTLTDLTASVNELNVLDGITASTVELNYMDGVTSNVQTQLNNTYHPPLLEPIWSDHLISDQSWLRADTFSWQNGTTYSTAYNHLVSDISGITAETETIGSYTVTFYRAADGHKICLADQETIVSNIFSATGIAWYYILDTTNTQFKLPRTKWGFEGLRDNVGNKIDESLPNISGTFRNYGWNCSWIIDTAQTGALYRTGTARGINTAGGTPSSSAEYLDGFGIDASLSSSTYQDNAPVQERATQMYLYFYVGEYTQTAIQQTAGLNSELFNDKADTDLTNVSFGNMIDILYPVGSIYIGTTSTCPLAAIKGTWELVGADRVLQGAGNRGTVGSTLSESLPNINATFGFAYAIGQNVSGAVSLTGTPTTLYVGASTGIADQKNQFAFNASNSSSIYQNNAHVQQDAYLVNIWRRTA